MYHNKAQTFSKSLLVLCVIGYGKNKKKMFKISKIPLVLHPPLVRAVGHALYT